MLNKLFKGILLTCLTLVGMLTIGETAKWNGSEAAYGKASYYSRSANRHLTSSGERHYSDSMVCAHKYAPFGTLLKVTNLRNGKEVVVKVNDRGPFVKGRLVDVSHGAARELGMLSAGVVEVKVEMYDPNKQELQPSSVPSAGI